MATYAIGDIQGCFDELRQLLKKINFRSDRDILWFTGDLVNRGPKSLETLRFVRSLGQNAIVVLGNHDLHLLALAHSHNKPGRKDTLDEILHANDRDALLQWLQHRPLMHVADDLQLCLVHAGIHPHWSIARAKSLAEEVEVVLRSERSVDFFANMYGDKPATWSDELSGYSRLRYITNVFTRLRFCTTEGALALDYKSEPGTQPAGFLPWFNVESRTNREHGIIFGHWSTLILAHNIEYPNVYPLDTGCLWGGQLTAMRIDDQSFSKTALQCSPQCSPAYY
ncbi:MAG: symmetrical bis(5'-nucleosyl)-tetraphosphatase [Gammaproteobacteria bacterium]|nr:symmetrical bis(5'-nucleosyl)-tetraphosphatase [Gammaproteobacteria bacterium]